MWVILVVGRCLRKKMIAMRRTPPRLANYLKTCASSILYSSLACNNETERERERFALENGKCFALCSPCVQDSKYVSQLGNSLDGTVLLR